MGAVAFIGVGNMGGPMARNLLKAGHQVRVFDLSAAAIAACVDAGARKADTVAQCVADAAIVVSMLPAGPQVREIYTRDIIGKAPAGALFIDCSTIDVATAREVADLAAAQGYKMVDAPVSGGVGGAQAATLTFMVGGTDAAFAAAQPILEVMGKKIVHCGGIGNGQAAKICNNMMLGIEMIAVCEAFNLAAKLGLDAQKLFDVASTASGQCWSLTSYCPVPGPVPASPANRDYQPGFAGAMMLKDLKLAQGAAQDFAAHTPLGNAAMALYQQFCDQGGAGQDFSAIIQHLREKAGA